MVSRSKAPIGALMASVVLSLLRTLAITIGRGIKSSVIPPTIAGTSSRLSVHLPHIGIVIKVGKKLLAFTSQDARWPDPKAASTTYFVSKFRVCS